MKPKRKVVRSNHDQIIDATHLLRARENEFIIERANGKKVIDERIAKTCLPPEFSHFSPHAWAKLLKPYGLPIISSKAGRASQNPRGGQRLHNHVRLVARAVEELANHLSYSFKNPAIADHLRWLISNGAQGELYNTAVEGESLVEETPETAPVPPAAMPQPPETSLPTAEQLQEVDAIPRDPWQYSQHPPRSTFNDDESF